MKRTSIIWIAILSVAVLATVTTTYFLLEIKEKSLAEKGKTEVTNESNEMTILNEIFAIREKLGGKRDIKDISSTPEAYEQYTTPLTMGTLKLSIPYEVKELETVDEKQTHYFSDNISATLEQTKSKVDDKDIYFKDIFVKSPDKYNSLLPEKLIKTEDLQNFLDSYKSTYDMYLDILNTYNESKVEYTSDLELKNQYIKYYLAAEIGDLDYVYKNDTKKVIFTHNLENEIVTSATLTIYKEDTVYELFMQYNFETIPEAVMHDFEYIISTL